ncbi:MAG: hypothetical protein BWY70_01765 [Bacteroidetes bacterium ADurb.Bin408]|nr:MAG: hypothetical protein BWY70_01765 [Bacteroidetes bacterium ADurb.Bin408]
MYRIIAKGKDVHYSIETCNEAVGIKKIGVKCAGKFLIGIGLHGPVFCSRYIRLKVISISVYSKNQLQVMQGINKKGIENIFTVIEKLKYIRFLPNGIVICVNKRQ